MRPYPCCDKCGGVIDPTRYDDSDVAYDTADGLFCRECFISQQEEYLRINTDDFARLLGARVVELK